MSNKYGTFFWICAFLHVFCADLRPFCANVRTFFFHEFCVDQRNFCKFCSETFQFGQLPRHIPRPVSLQNSQNQGLESAGKGIEHVRSLHADRVLFVSALNQIGAHNCDPAVWNRYFQAIVKVLKHMLHARIDPRIAQWHPVK